MNLSELLKQITPLPENLESRLIGVDLTARCDEYRSEVGPKLAAYLVHAANALPEVVKALEDCVNSLKRLEDKDGAYRVTCISEGEKALTLATTIKDA